MIFYDIVIRPIELIIEVIYTLMFRFFQDPGMALFGVSIAVSFMVLPLYLRADAIQEEEQKKQDEMRPWMGHIKKCFRGDERYMLTSAYYREAGYRPLYALRSVLSLLLQIPFFIAAYHYLSHLEILNGCSMGIISDLGKPDGLISFGGFAIHVLPVLMTCINIISGMIYSKDAPLKTKIQIVVLALVFLVLLYPSPSGLVIYWTMNNVFSLCKNIVMKHVKNKKRFLFGLAVLVSVFFMIYSTVRGKWSDAFYVKDYETLAVYVLITFFPLILIGLRSRLIRKIIPAETKNVTGADFYLLSVALTAFFGLVIPMAVIYSSPQDFINVFYYRNPLTFVLTTFLTYAGLFLAWGSIIFYMLSAGHRTRYCQLLSFVLFGSLIDYYCFKADVGTMGLYLNFRYQPWFATPERYGSIIVMIVLCAVLLLLWIKQMKVYRYLSVVLIAVFLTMVCYQGAHAEREISKVEVSEILEDEDVGFKLSRNGKNVVVIMMDAAISGYLPFFIEEKPELIEQYDGFVYYPNAVSTGLYTNYGAQAIYGGYEYTTGGMNARSDTGLDQKFNEAFRVMPVLFGENGYNVTVSDISYAGYQNFPDFSIYSDYPYVNAFHYGDRYSWGGQTIEETWSMMERNFVFYSLYRCAPPILQDNIYDDANYFAGGGKKTWYPGELKSEYKALELLPQHTEILDEENGELMVYANMTAHAEGLLQLPDYTMPEVMDNSSYDFEMVRTVDGITLNIDSPAGEGEKYYHANMAALLKLGEWFDYLREEGVWDNTRIIVVSDHGRANGQFESMLMPDGPDVQGVNCLLLVKDYNSKGFSTDDRFMTNADVPSIALEGIVEAPVNPFTGEKISMDAKADGVDVFVGTDWELQEGNTFDENADWYHVRDDIFIGSNWIKLER